MATSNDFPLTLTIRAFDKVTGPLRAIGKEIRQSTEPFRKFSNGLKAAAEESGLFKLKERFGDIGHSLKDVGHEVFELGKHLLEMEAIGGIALFELFKGSIEAGAQLEDLAKRTDFTVDQFAALRFAAGQAHVSQEEFNASMEKFAVNLGEAKAGTGSLLLFLQRVSPALALQVKGSKNAGEAFDLITKAFEKVQDPAKRAALAQETFGRGGKKMAEFLHLPAEQIKALKDRYSELAGSQEEAAKQAEEGEKSLNELGAAFTGLRTAALTPLMPVFRDIVESISKFAADNRGSLKKWAEDTGKSIEDWIKRDGLKDLGESLKSIASTAKTVAEAIGGLKGVFVLLAAYMGSGVIKSVIGLVRALGGLTPVITTVVGAVGTFVTSITAGAGVMEAFGLVLAANPVGLVIVGLTALAGLGLIIYKNWAPIKQFFIDLWDVMRHPIAALEKRFGGHGGTADAGAGQFGMGGPKILKRAAPSAFPQLGGKVVQEAHVKVDFANAPKGTRVSVDRDSKVPVDMSLGHAMVTP